MSEGGEARTFICDVCGERLPDDVVIEHYCVEGGEARNHEAEVERVPRAPHGIRQRDFRMGWEAALDAVRRSPQGEDHEAGIEAMAELLFWAEPWAIEGYQPPTDMADARELAKRLEAAYLSRCPSPEREPTQLGTVCEQCERRTMEPVYTEDGDAFCGRCAVQLASKKTRVSPDHDPGRTD